MRKSKINLSEAQLFLSKQDRGLARVISSVGDCMLGGRGSGTVFEYLARSIVYQQLSGKAAGTIHGRMLNLFEHNKPTSIALSALPMSVLRSAGLSHSKCLALYDLAAWDQGGKLPGRKTLNNMSDEEVVQALIGIRGIGEWTAQMLLIFDLERPDVLPVRDLGVLKGYQKMRGFKELPDPAKLGRAGLRWRPYRSVATWYLWRCLEVPLKAN